MVHDLQKAGIWKRIAAWMFDGILFGVVAVACCFALSGVLGYDSYSQTLDQAYDAVETEYGVSFDITETDYNAMSESDRANYDAAYDTLCRNDEAMYAYNMMIQLSLVIVSLGLLLAVVLWELVIPLWFGNGQTLGKKIFGLCLVRNDGVRMNNMQLFARTVLGKYTIETMIPVYILIMLFWGTIDLTGTMMLGILLVAQLCCLLFTRNHCPIHDLLAGTVVVDLASQTIFESSEELLEYQKRIAADRAARAPY